MDTLPVVNERSTDLEIFLAIQAQQVRALDLLYDRYGKLVYSMAFRILNNIEEAEEVTQEIFLRLWQRSEIYQPNRGTLSGFLITLTRSRSIDRIRAYKSVQEKLKRIQIFTDCVLQDSSPLEFVIVEERSALVREALKQLSPKDCHLLETSYYGGLSQSEIANREGLPLGTVKSRTRQALKRLRAALDRLI